ncbi:MAG: class I SAM-dependent methyltransferase [Thermoanaerobaculaceae bacterium]|jgi:SAM-dependent methyltransferase|nr:class I SAM-dependent methyltransferase [Thermoanaerobaculaceae bacterium]
MGLAAWLAQPSTRGLDLDDPRTTVLRRRILLEKGFLRQVYREWYGLLAEALPDGAGAVVELGSGAGFAADHVPGLVPTELLITPHVRVVADGLALPFASRSLRGIVMTNVLHHLPRPRRFFAEASRCVRAGGAVAMIEPWITPWSRLVYRHLHHEPCDDHATEWEFPPGGPLSAANQALPWILFARDRGRFEREAAGWKVEQVRPLMPLAYLLSGGLSWRSLLPGALYRAWRVMERPLEGRLTAMFALVVLRRLI